MNIPSKIAAALALLACIFLAEQYIESRGYSRAQAEYMAKANAQALEADKAARANEVALQKSIGSLTNAYIAQKNATAAAAGRADDSLRQLQSALGGAASLNPAAAAGADDTARARFVVGQCAAALSEVAKAADASEERLTALQAYVKAIVETCKP